MASPTHSVALSLLPPRYTLPKPHTHLLLSLSSSSTPYSLLLSRRRSSALSPPYRPPRRRSSHSTCLAYVTGPPSDPIVADNGPKLNVSSSDTESTQSPPSVISWGLLSSLLLQHKLRLAVSVATLVGCTACTLSMPLYSGKFFEVLIGKTPKPLWDVLGRIAVLYALEPIFTILFVVNLNSVWEKVMSNLRAQIFQRVLIQKEEQKKVFCFWDFWNMKCSPVLGIGTIRMGFDLEDLWNFLTDIRLCVLTYVGELTALLTSDLGSLKDIVSENISRDRGFRALSEASYSTLSESQL
ncbi:ABC transporter B family member 28-like [Rhododendron vialii]|uniref:ABC transporter B family member 28-like n=1 Tax=Rhododendron vialii TaxID=182163 RepID=UPI00265E5D83|nr:ABC transporter B family member 28-like [Rhododendron vialii]